MLRRITSAIAASAVVLSGLVWSAAPATAMPPETITSNYSTWAASGGTATLDITINGFPNMTTTVAGYPYKLVFYGMNPSSSNTGTGCGTGGSNTQVSFSTAAPVGAGSTGSNPRGFTSGSTTYQGCQWASTSDFRFAYDSDQLFTSSTIQTLSFPTAAFAIPTTGAPYGVQLRGGGTWTGLVSEICFGNCPTDGSSPELPQITLEIDPNGGRCSVESVTGLQGTWTIAPSGAPRGTAGEGSCSKPGAVWTGFNTKPDGSGLGIARGGNLNLTSDNRLYAQYVTPRVSSAPTDVVATPGLKKVTVTWKAPSDVGTGPINGYRVQASPGSSSCVTNLASANMLECTYTNLRPGTKYTFAVQALNQAGWSDLSAASNGASPFDLLFDSLSRPEVKLLFISRGSRLEAEGRAPGLDAGATLTPVMQVGAAGAFVPLTRNTTTVDRDGTFSWSRKLDRGDNGKPVSLYFTYSDAKTTTLTAKLGATIGLPSRPRDVKVTSDAAGITVSWKAPARDGGSPITGYEMKSDLRAPAWAQSRFVSCTVKAPTTSCTMPASTSVFDPNKTYTFSVVAKTERGTSREATEKWKGQLYRLNIFKRARVDSEVLLSFSAFGWPKDARGFEIQAKVGQNGEWKKQGTARLDPDYVEPIGDWIGMLPKSVTAGSEVFYRVKSDRGFSNEVRFRLSSSFEYSFG